MIKNLVKAAAELDEAGFHIEADLMDRIMQKVAEELNDLEEDGEEPNFGFMDQDEEEDLSEEEEEDSDSEEEHSVDECLEYCKSFSHEDKVELIKALLDSMMD